MSHNCKHQQACLLGLAVAGLSYLHRHQTIVHQYLLCQEIGANSCFVAGTELLVDLIQRLSVRMPRASMRLRALPEGVVRTYWFIKLVFPTPLSPSMITYITMALSDIVQACLGDDSGSIPSRGSSFWKPWERVVMYGGV